MRKYTLQDNLIFFWLKYWCKMDERLETKQCENERKGWMIEVLGKSKTILWILCVSDLDLKILQLSSAQINL